MSLLEALYGQYTVMDPKAAGGPEGGWAVGWTPGATVQMALGSPAQAQKAVAGAQREEAVYNALFPAGTPVRRNDRLRRAEGGDAVYRVRTSPVEAPGPSGVRVMRAEVIETGLPT